MIGGRHLAAAPIQPLSAVASMGFFRAGAGVAGLLALSAALAVAQALGIR